MIEELRGRGIGHALIHHLEEQARQAGCDRLDLNTSEQRTDAHAAYRRLGFSQETLRFVKRLS